MRHALRSCMFYVLFGPCTIYRYSALDKAVGHKKLKTHKISPLCFCVLLCGACTLYTLYRDISQCQMSRPMIGVAL
jgi:hypothetical protein